MMRPPRTAQQLQTLLQAVRASFPAEIGDAPSAEAPLRLAERPGPARATRWPWRRALSGRTGGRLVYAVGDVHGRLDLLQDLVLRIGANAAGRPYELILCGDYVDRGPDSARVLEWLLCLRARLGERLRLLTGNHEQTLLRFLDQPAWGALWLERFGGAATLAAYGVPRPPPRSPPETFAAARDQLLANMPASHLRLLQGLELMVAVGDYAFVHAGISPDAPLAEQTEDELLWSRGEFLDARGPFEKIIVHGHSWTDDQPTLLEHRIGLDTGAYETGVLTAVRLDDERREVIQALDAAAAERRAPRLVSRPPDYVAAAEDATRAMSAPGLSLSRCAP